MKPVLANSLLVQRENFPSPARDSTVALYALKIVNADLPSIAILLYDALNLLLDIGDSGDPC